MATIDERIDWQRVLAIDFATQFAIYFHILTAIQRQFISTIFLLSFKSVLFDFYHFLLDVLVFLSPLDCLCGNQQSDKIHEMWIVTLCVCMWKPFHKVLNFHWPYFDKIRRFVLFCIFVLFFFNTKFTHWETDVMVIN